MRYTAIASTGIKPDAHAGSFRFLSDAEAVALLRRGPMPIYMDTQDAAEHHSIARQHGEG